MSLPNIEKRVAAVERQVARLNKLNGTTKPAHPLQTLEQIHGIFENDDAFREAKRLGRQWRKSQNGPARLTKAKRR